jgi:hypothetical protein
MKRIWYVFIFSVLLSACDTPEREAHAAIDEYLKNSGFLVEELKIVSMKPITREQYIRAVIKEAPRRTLPFNMMNYTVDGRIPDSLNRFVDSMMDIQAEDDFPIRQFTQQVMSKKEREDFAFVVQTECRVSGKLGKKESGKATFLFCKHKDLGVKMVGKGFLKNRRRYYY